MPDYNVQVIVPGSQSTTVELPGIAGPPGPQGPVGPAGTFNTGLLDLRYVTLTGNQTVSGLKYFVQDNIIYTTNPLTDPYTSLIIDYSYINNLFLKPVPEYRPVVSPNPNYLYTGIDGGTESQMYFDTGDSRWKFYYGGLNPIHLVAQSPIIKAGDPITFAAQVPMNGWTSSAGSPLLDFRLHYTTLHKSSHQIGEKDYLDPDTINAVAKTGNQNISGIKNFYIRPTVNGTGVLLSGEAAGLPNTLVYTTGNQTISGVKSFADIVNFIAPEDGQIVGFISGKSSPGFTQSLTIQGLGTEEPFLNLTAAGNTISIGEGTFGLYAQAGTNMAFGGPDSMSIQGTRELYANNITAYFKDINANNIYAQTGDFNALDLNNVDNLLISGIDIYVENGNVSLTNTPTVRGNPVLTGVDLTQYATISNLNLTGANLNNKINTLSGVSVLTYGNQGIYGVKTFYDDVFMNNFTAYGTGTIVNIVSSDVDSNYLILNITGGAIAGGIFFVTGVQGSGLGPIMGYDLNNNKFKIGTGSRNGGITTLDNIATENFVNTNAVLISGNQSINGNKSFYGDMLLSGDNNRIGKRQYLSTDQDFLYIRNQDGQIILSAEEDTLFDYQEVRSVLWSNRALIDSNNVESVNWDIRYLANQNGSPVLTWTGDNIGIGTNNPSEKLQVDGNIRLNDNGKLIIYDQPNGQNNQMGWQDSELVFTNLYDDNVNYSNVGIIFRNGPSGENSLYSRVANQNLSYLYIPTGRQGYIAINSDLVATGSILNNKINSLSGYVNSQDNIFSGQTFNTGSRLDSKINSLSGYVDSKSITLPTTIVYTTGNQIISGIKTFATEIIAPNLVYTTGYQQIDGNKVFIGSPFQIDNGLSLSITSGGIYTQPHATYFNNNNDINFDFGHPYLNTRLSIGYNTGILRASINSQNNEREIKIYETGGFMSTLSYGPYLRMGRSGILISETSENKVGIGTLFPQQKVHISGGNLRVDGNVSANNLNDLVYTTGTQIINGQKSFTANINISGASTQVITFGRSNNADVRARIITYTGDYGLTFMGRIGVVPSAHGYGIVFEGGPTLGKKGYFTAGATTVPTGYQFATLDWVNRILSGTWTADQINIKNANPVLTQTNQTISGVKDFASRPTVNGTGVLLSGEIAPSLITIQDEGSSQGSVSTLNFVGAGVSASVTGSTATITINGGTGAGISFVSPPTTPNSAGTSGQMALDENYAYYCISNNNWRRSAISSW